AAAEPDDPFETHELKGPNCEALVEAAALIVAFSVDPVVLDHFRDSGPTRAPRISSVPSPPEDSVVPLASSGEPDPDGPGAAGTLAPETTLERTATPNSENARSRG